MILRIAIKAILECSSLSEQGTSCLERDATSQCRLTKKCATGKRGHGSLHLNVGAAFEAVNQKMQCKQN